MVIPLPAHRLSAETFDGPRGTEEAMPYIEVGQENSGSIELYYEDHGSGRPAVLEPIQNYAVLLWPSRRH